MIEIALIKFSEDASVVGNPTTSYSTFSNAVNNLNADGGTNWEDALKKVANVNFNDNDPTYVIFASDGNPTFYVTNAGHGDKYSNGIYGTGVSEEPNITYWYLWPCR